jgi:hypothetical protein
MIEKADGNRAMQFSLFMSGELLSGADLSIKIVDEDYKIICHDLFLFLKNIAHFVCVYNKTIVAALQKNIQKKWGVYGVTNIKNRQEQKKNWAHAI